MYSYVTVGEFIAFVIGWNMVLEYLIGTAACACALSACFDALTNGRITNGTGAVFGTIFGKLLCQNGREKKKREVAFLFKIKKV